MIRLTKNVTGFIYLSLDDKRLTSSNSYTILFVNEVTNEQVNLTLADVSSFKNRYSKFQILNTSFNTKTIGFWRYYVTQAGSGATIIATGKFELVDTNLSDTDVIRYNGYNGAYKTYTV
jgi:hypothetical protein